MPVLVIQSNHIIQPRVAQDWAGHLPHCITRHIGIGPMIIHEVSSIPGSHINLAVRHFIWDILVLSFCPAWWTVVFWRCPCHHKAESNFGDINRLAKEKARVSPITSCKSR